MKNNVLTIMKKECTRFFSDKRLLLTTLVLPGILIFAMYTLMGNFTAGLFAVDDDYIYQVHAVNMPASIAGLLSPPEMRINIINTPEANANAVRQQITDRETDLLLVFPPNFDELVAVFDPATATAPAPNVEIWANSARSESAAARNIVTAVITNYHHALTHRFSINAPTADAPDGQFELATEADTFAMVIGFMIPMLFIIMIFSGCQAIAPESIAGEKERGTLGGMLVTPASRRDLALGKILSISIFCLLSAIGSMAGTVLAMPNLLGMDGGNIWDFYSLQDFILLFMVATSTTLVFVSMLSVMSAYAKSVKEANTYAAPFMIISMVCGLASTILGGIPSEVFFYLIPIFNSALNISAIFSFEVSALNVAVTTGVNLVFTMICVVALAQIFSSEKIVFDK